MKKIVIVLAITTSITSIKLFSQPPPPPSDHNLTGNQAADTGGGAPIEGGLFILLGLGAAYGGKKIYDMCKESLEE